MPVSPLARYLVLGRGDSPRWLVAPMMMRSDIRPAEVRADGGYLGWSTGPDSVAHWAALQIGGCEPVSLVPATCRSSGSPAREAHDDRHHLRHGR